MTVSSFSAALHFTRELVFGVLAILGCIVVQCLILAFIFLAKAQIRFVFLQAQMLRRLYGRRGDSEQRPSAHAKEATKKATNVRVKLPKAEPSAQAQPAELPAVQTSPTKASPIVETSTWQTKAIVACKTGGRRPYAMKQVDVLAPVGPPGLGPPDPARLLALAQSPDPIYDKLHDGPVSTLPSDLADTPKATHQMATTDSVDIESLLGCAPVEPYTEYGTTRNANAKSMTIFEHTEESSGDVNEQSAEASGAGSIRKFARGSAIRKVQPAQFENVQRSSDAKADHFVNTVISSRFDATAAMYKNVKPAEFGDLQDRFTDTSLLKKASRSEHRQTLPAKAPPPTPQEAARKALGTASKERESSRVQLNTNYSIPRALEFDEKAKTYNTMREKLAALMPGKRLTIEDERLFPWLSAKDTVEPQVSTAPNGPQEELNVLPSPPTSSDEKDVQHQPREDPTPLIAKASRAFQVLLQATKNIKERCPKCNSKFCPEGYERNSKLKLKSAKDLYHKSRNSVINSYGGDEVPERVSKQLPEIKEC